MTDLPSQFDHEHYEELCALATAGALTLVESEALIAHLDDCAECHRLFLEYRSLANEGIPMLADLQKAVPETISFYERKALTRLLKSVDVKSTSGVPRVLTSSRFTETTVWRGLVAATLIVGIAFASYRIGERRHADTARVTSIPDIHEASITKDSSAVELALKNAERREADLEAIASERAESLKALSKDSINAQERLDSLTASLATTKTDSAAQIRAATEERDESKNRLQDAQRLYSNAQDELNSLRSQRKQDLARIASLESQVGGLTVALNEQSSRSKDDEQFLSSDKDIRDLIGARNLYIADIMDVSEDGSSKKPFGRVFYTKTKSLVFYAYDLDRQPGVKQASTFHVWGRTGTDDKKPLSLGVLYLDSETNRRWTLRVNNPEQLARLDAVFVTVEPHEQTEKPTGKPFLYASLKREPNHP